MAAILRWPEIVADAAAGWPQLGSIRVAAVGGVRAGTAHGRKPARIVAGTGVGALRHLGVHHVLDHLAGHPPDTTWLLHTDADTTVPPDWALAHLRHAAAAACGVAGTAHLDVPDELSPEARRRYPRILRDGLDGDRHRHVYGANLGVRADAYLAVGGFPAHGLWRRLQDGGSALARPAELQVRTSARLRGRAAGGLADLRLALHDGVASVRASAALDTRDGA